MPQFEKIEPRSHKDTKQHKVLSGQKADSREAVVSLVSLFQLTENKIAHLFCPVIDQHMGAIL
jgi:hypothetical protein